MPMYSSNLLKVFAYCHIATRVVMFACHAFNLEAEYKFRNTRLSSLCNQSDIYLPFPQRSCVCGGGILEAVLHLSLEVIAFGV
jgi:hypothetical protein